nr:hypothetical protein 13 [Pelagibacteraceae bacterium]
MDLRTAVRDIGNMSPDEINSYYNNNAPSAGKMPENEDDYYNPGKSKTTAEDLLAGAAEAGGGVGAGTAEAGDGPDSPAAEPGQAPGAPKDYSEFRKKYGLEYNEDHAKMKSPGAYSESTGGDGFASDDGAIFTEAGVYVGTASDDDYSSYSKLQSDSSSIKKEAEGKGFTDFSSLSDVAGAVHWLTKDDKPEEEVKEEEEKPEYKKSERLAKAQARMKAYDKVFVGKQGDIIFGKNPDYAQDFSNAYKKALRSDPDYQWKFDKRADAKKLKFSKKNEETQQ